MLPIGRTASGAVELPRDGRARSGNTDHQNRRLGKAGIRRHLGRRPITRGVAREPQRRTRWAAAKVVRRVDRAPVGPIGRAVEGRPDA